MEGGEVLGPYRSKVPNMKVANTVIELDNPWR